MNHVERIVHVHAKTGINPLPVFIRYSLVLPSFEYLWKLKFCHCLSTVIFKTNKLERIKYIRAFYIDLKTRVFLRITKNAKNTKLDLNLNHATIIKKMTFRKIIKEETKISKFERNLFMYLDSV